MSRSPKARLQAECAAMGLSTAGTVAQLEDRLAAAAEAIEDTAAALSAKPAPAPQPVKATRQPKRVDPGHAIALGAAATGISYLAGWL